MLKNYDDDKDLYATIGSICFHNNYEDNLEFHPVTHALQPEGKARRGQAKVIQLAISYGMSAKSLAESINCSEEEAQTIIDNFYKGFPGVKKFTDDSQKMLKEKGYVTDMWGRRRRIPDATLPEWEVVQSNKNTASEFNPLLGVTRHIDDGLSAKIQMYLEKLSKTKWKKDADPIIKQAEKDGLTVRNNKGFISRALRQCLNARIQGTAASMTKKAMIAIHDDKELNDLGFRLLITVHDEVLGECPTENSQAVAKRLSEIMVNTAKEKCICKFKCDPYIVKRWYADEAAGELLKDYTKLVKGDTPISEDEAIKVVANKYPMIQEKYVREMCNGTFDPNAHEDI